MGVFKNTLIECRQCRRKILVKPADAERGEITCSHRGCDTVNVLSTAFYYHESILDGLVSAGRLTHTTHPSLTFRLQPGLNTLGVGAEVSLTLPRLMHRNQCYISRLHCSITVLFDKWSGNLRYQLQDGSWLAEKTLPTPSKNGTALNGLRLKAGELVDVPADGLITLGGMDTFCLTHHLFSPDTLRTYKTALDFDPDRTE